jgi:ribonuclease-3
MEWGQKEGKTISFELIEDVKTKRNAIFKIAVKIDGSIKGTGVGTNKKKAEQIAAAEALLQL